MARQGETGAMEINIRFGPTADSISKQLRTQGARYPDGCDDLQRDADAITRLKVRGLLGGAIARRAYFRLFTKITKGAKAIRQARGTAKPEEG